MSVTLYALSLQPWANGWIWSAPIDGVLTYRHLAYQQPDGETWFGGTPLDVGNPPEGGGHGWVHHLISSVRNRPIPPKLDTQVFVISDLEFERLQILERVFWLDYNEEIERIFAPHIQAAEAAGFEWVPPELGNDSPEHMQAIQYAHARALAEDR